MKEESVYFKIKTCTCFKTFKSSAYTNYGRTSFPYMYLLFSKTAGFQSSLGTEVSVVYTHIASASHKQNLSIKKQILPK